VGIVFDDNPSALFEHVVGIQVGIPHRYAERGRTVAALDRPRELHAGDVERPWVKREVLRADLDYRAASAASETATDWNVNVADWWGPIATEKQE